jgi:hypothetical protein
MRVMSRLAVLLGVLLLAAPASAARHDDGLVDPYQEEDDGLVDPYQDREQDRPVVHAYRAYDDGLVDPYQDEDDGLVDPYQDTLGPPAPAGLADPYLERLLPDLDGLLDPYRR